MERALESGAPLVHQEWGDNILQSAGAEFGPVARAFDSADVVISERFLTGGMRRCRSSRADASPHMTQRRIR